jgi:glycosyltransferase involved in cell wall biosynthesis
MPAISVVIPTYRRHGALARVLDLLERQDAGMDAFEVIVVADDRDDDPEAVARAVGARPYRVRRLGRAAPGVSAARNTGWRAAQAPLVLFLGDDILPADSLLSEHLDWHRGHPEPTVGVLGRVEWARELRVTPFMRWLDQGVQFDYGTIRGQEADWWHFYTSNASIKRELLERVEGFDEGFPFGYEDLDIAKRMSDLGFRLLFDPDARAEHLHRPTVAEWRDRMTQVAAAERRFVGKHPELRPYFRTMLEASEQQSPGLARRSLMRLAPALARVVPLGTPWLGPRVARLAAAQWRRELATPFMVAWRAADGP